MPPKDLLSASEISPTVALARAASTARASRLALRTGGAPGSTASASGDRGGSRLQR
jgi:hypothetical protein